MVSQKIQCQKHPCGFNESTILKLNLFGVKCTLFGSKSYILCPLCLRPTSTEISKLSSEHQLRVCITCADQISSTIARTKCLGYKKFSGPSPLLKYDFICEVCSKFRCSSRMTRMLILDQKHVWRFCYVCDHHPRCSHLSGKCVVPRDLLSDTSLLM